MKEEGNRVKIICEYLDKCEMQMGLAMEMNFF